MHSGRSWVERLRIKGLGNGCDVGISHNRGMKCLRGFVARHPRGLESYHVCISFFFFFYQFEGLLVPTVLEESRVIFPLFKSFSILSPITTIFEKLEEILPIILS